MKLFLDAGHESKVDNGACFGKLKEAYLTRVIRAFCANDLLKNGFQDFVLVPELGGWWSSQNLQKKINWINKNSDHNDYLISIHVNSSLKGLPSGVEVWGYKSLPIMKFYQAILNGVVKETGLKDRGVKDEADSRYGRLGIVHDTKPIAVLVECGFINGDYDFLVNTPQKFGWGISHGFTNFLED